MSLLHTLATAFTEFFYEPKVAEVVDQWEGAWQSMRRSATPMITRRQTTPYERRVINDKAEYFYRNTALVPRLGEVFETYVVGSGMPMIPASSDPEWNERALAWLQRWKPFACLDSMDHFDRAQGRLAWQFFKFGEWLLLLTSGDTPPYRPRVQVVDVRRLRTPGELAQQEGKTIFDGVECDQNGRPIRYWIADTLESTAVNFGSATCTPHDANFVVHTFDAPDPHARRGMSLLASVINRLHDLDDLQMLEMQAAKLASETALVITTETGEVTAEELRKERFAGGKTGGSGTAGGSNVTRDQYYRDVLGAQARVLRKGDKVEQLGGLRPSVVTREFWDDCRTEVCAGVGIPIELVLYRSIQGTVARSVLDMANSHFRIRSSQFADGYRRVYEYVIGWAIKNDPTLKGAPEDWASCFIRPPRAVNVDSGRNASGEIAELAAGTKTLEEICGDDGDDWMQHARQTIREVAWLKSEAEKAGLTLADVRQFPGKGAPPPIDAEQPQGKPKTPKEGA